MPSDAAPSAATEQPKNNVTKLLKEALEKAEKGEIQNVVICTIDHKNIAGCRWSTPSPPGLLSHLLMIFWTRLSKYYQVQMFPPEPAPPLAAAPQNPAGAKVARAVRQAIKKARSK